MDAGRIPRPRTVAVLAGLALMVAGVQLIRWASPSPHGYIEVFFGMPLVAAGLLSLGAGLLRYEALVLRSLGWLIFVGVGGMLVATVLGL